MHGIDHHDHVADVYFRKLFSEAAQDKLIRRIDWICDNVSGKRVLDIGCSQGIVPYLLAQRNKEIVGVDIDPEAIAYANQLVSSLDSEEAKNAQFLQADIFSLNPDDVGAFDCVLLTEVIEHFDNPRELMFVASKFCKEGGSIIVTTPFGLDRAPDHKVTFYNSRLVSTFADIGELALLDVNDKYYRVIITKNQTGVFKLDESHAIIQEQKFEESENAAQDEIERLKGVVLDVRAANQKTRDQLTELQEKRREDNDRVSRFKEQTERFKSQNELYKAHISRYQELINKYQQDANTQGHLKQLDTSLERLSGTFNQKAESLAQLLSELPRDEFIREHIEEQNASLNLRLEQTFGQIEKQLEQLAAVQSLQDHQRSTEKRLEEFQSSTNRSFEESLNLLASFKDEYDSLMRDRQEISSLRSQLLDSQHQIESLKCKYEESQTLLQEQKTALMQTNITEQQLRQSQSQLKELEVKYNDAQGILKEQTRLIAQQHSIDRKYEVAQQKLSKQETELVKLKQQCLVLNSVKRDLVHQKSKSVQRYNLLRDSFSYKFGRNVVDALYNPGLNTLLLPFVVLKDFMHSIRKRKLLSKRSTSSSKTLSLSQVTHEYQKAKINSKVKEEVYQSVLADGIVLPEKVSEPAYPPSKVVFYICHMSLPLMSNGYATRTHHLVKAMSEKYKHLKVYTRLGYPYDLKMLRDKLSADGNIDECGTEISLDGVLYHYLKLDEYRMDNLDPLNYILAYADSIVEQAMIHKPRLLHAASDYRNGVAALIAGRRLGIPVHYEMRGLWHVTRASKDPSYKDSLEYTYISQMEELVVKHSDRVYTITRAMAELYANMGHDLNKFRLLANGVNVDSFAESRMSPSQNIISRYNLQSKIVLGYIGSMVSYEGLDLLLEACAELRDRKLQNFHLLMVGDGEQYQLLCELSEKLSLGDYITFTGRLPHDEIAEIYSVIDIAPFPRTSAEICELVSPIKPMEAMASQKAVVASNVRPLREMVADGETGVIFEADNSVDLAEKLLYLIESKQTRQRLAKNALNWVTKHRDWKRIIKGMEAREI